MSYLITPTLLNGFNYYRDHDCEYCSESCNARSDFLKLLNKDQIEKTESMILGIQLEKEIYDYCENGVLTENEAVEYIGNLCKGGLWQQSVRKELGNFLLYGKADVIIGSKIYDIKFTGSYDVGKYFKSMQHRIYMYCTGINDFSYLISDGKNFFKEDYACANKKDVEYEILESINELKWYLKNDLECLNIFNEKWQAN